MQVFRVFGIVPDARSPSGSFENPVAFATADVAAADSYKTTALPIELGRREFPNDSGMARSQFERGPGGTENHRTAIVLRRL